MKKVIGIEVMPDAESCEQGCPQCFLANRNGKTFLNKKINPNVQKTFSILERFLYTKKTGYDLHFSSQFNLFPEIKKPALLKMARFETNRSITEPGKAESYSNGISEIINNYKLDPIEVCFSFVPKSPLLSFQESQVIQKIIKEISLWYLNEKRNKKITCTIRTNFIPLNRLQRIEKSLIEQDKDILNYITLNLFNRQRISPGRFKAIQHSDIEGSLYYSTFSKRIFGNKFELTNRVISHTSKKYRDNFIDEDGHHFETTQAIRIQGFYTGVLLSPVGVMLNHTSLAINNPILWMSHKDFRKTIQSFKKYKKIKTIFDRIIIQNIVMYNILLEEIGIKDVREIEKKVMMEYFEKTRKNFF